MQTSLQSLGLILLSWTSFIASGSFSLINNIRTPKQAENNAPPYALAVKSSAISQSLTSLNCNFNEATFCKYTSYGWGFSRSVRKAASDIVRTVYRTSSNKESGLRPLFPTSMPPGFTGSDHFPCTDGNTQSHLEKEVVVNYSQPVCLHFSYLLDSDGYLSAKFGSIKWSVTAAAYSKYYSRRWLLAQWHNVSFPLSLDDQSEDRYSSIKTVQLQIAGSRVCVDNFSVVWRRCQLVQGPGHIPGAGWGMFGSMGDTALWLGPLIAILVGVCAAIFICSVVCAHRGNRRPRNYQRGLIREVSVHSLPTMVHIRTPPGIILDPNGAHNRVFLFTEDDELSGRGSVVVMQDVDSTPANQGPSREEDPAVCNVDEMLTVAGRVVINEDYDLGLSSSLNDADLPRYATALKIIESQMEPGKV